MTKKPLSKLRALLDDDDTPVTPPPPKPAATKPKLKALIDDDEAPAAATTPAPAPAVQTSAAKGAAFEEKLGAAAADFLTTARKYAKKEPTPEPPRVAVPIEGASIVFCGDSPVMIMCGVNASWTDVACFHIPSLSTRHLLRADLEPKDAVDRTIEALQKHIKIQPNKRT